MKKIFLSFLCVACLLGTSSTVYAQKYGYVNLGNLLTEMPEVNTGSAELEAFQKSITDELQNKINSWEKKVQDLKLKVNELPAKDLKALEEQFLKEQDLLYNEEQNLANKMVEKRKQIMSPILQKVQLAILEFGKENGYTMIFDTSVSGTTLYVDDAIDLSKEILNKLGVKSE